MLNPRLRARDKLQAWRRQQEATRTWTLKGWAAAHQWDISKAGRVFDKGPNLEDLDHVEDSTGLLARDLIAKDNAAPDVPVNATERQLLAWYRAASPDLQQAVNTVLQRGTIGVSVSGPTDTPSAESTHLHPQAMHLLHDHAGRKRRHSR